MLHSSRRAPKHRPDPSSCRRSCPAARRHRARRTLHLGIALAPCRLAGFLRLEPVRRPNALHLTGAFLALELHPSAAVLTFDEQVMKKAGNPGPSGLSRAS